MTAKVTEWMNVRVAGSARTKDLENKKNRGGAITGSQITQTNKQTNISARHGRLVRILIVYPGTFFGPKPSKGIAQVPEAERLFSFFFSHNYQYVRTGLQSILYVRT